MKVIIIIIWHFTVEEQLVYYARLFLLLAYSYRTSLDTLITRKITKLQLSTLTRTAKSRRSVITRSAVTGNISRKFNFYKLIDNCKKKSDTF